MLFLVIAITQLIPSHNPGRGQHKTYLNAVNCASSKHKEAFEMHVSPSRTVCIEFMFWFGLVGDGGWRGNA